MLNSDCRFSLQNQAKKDHFLTEIKSLLVKFLPNSSFWAPIIECDTPVMWLAFWPCERAKSGKGRNANTRLSLRNGKSNQLCRSTRWTWCQCVDLHTVPFRIVRPRLWLVTGWTKFYHRPDDMWRGTWAKILELGLNGKWTRMIPSYSAGLSYYDKYWWYYWYYTGAAGPKFSGIIPYNTV